ncbi:MAG TPA: recombinase family protein [Caulobacteraceae bacterium]|nr:recombinase family protein [Caulobacteraceae bacterium]
MNAYFGYIRVSTPRQGEGVSLQEQRSAIEAHALRDGLSIAGWFEEQESASKQGRRVFSQLLAELEAGRAKGVIIHKIDRSARHLKDWAWLGELIDRGIDVRFVHENLDLTSRGGRLTADLLAVLAADYSRNLRDEVKKGLYGRLKQGVYPFRAPIGYLDTGAGRPKEIDPIKGPLIRQGFELYGTGRFNLDTLRTELHRLGLRRGNGTPLSKNGVHLILRNPFYIGIIHIQANGQTFQGGHRPLIPKAIFDRVQSVLDGRTNTKIIKHDFPLRRLLRCDACGHSLTGEVQKGSAYYRCHSAACRKVSLRESDIIDELRTFFSLIAFTDQDLRDRLAVHMDLMQAGGAFRLELPPNLRTQLRTPRPGGIFYCYFKWIWVQTPPANPRTRVRFSARPPAAAGPSSGRRRCPHVDAGRGRISARRASGPGPRSPPAGCRR